MTADQIILDEFAAWYLGDELDVTDEGFAAEIPDRAASSVEQMAEAAGAEGRAELIALLRALREDRQHPLHERIGNRTLLWWNHDDKAWKAFQSLADALIAGLQG